ncbi:hypothetical protein HBB16_16770 [Pseudonocardia sp. MCCB 268]|nr:hypothetical protein [Pseudonocardia cytotoxica]
MIRGRRRLDQIRAEQGVTLTSNGAVEMDATSRAVQSVARFDVRAGLAGCRRRSQARCSPAEHVGVGQRVSEAFPTASSPAPSPESGWTAWPTGPPEAHHVLAWPDAGRDRHVPPA